ncbi:UbiD family decarboxylase [Schlesneria sp. T3-172]|uniref:UbiD family decarboxylase n=1 Tax=Schlesneria sphaerica TaxID=3373610 RepID=UPI0037CB484D
MSHASLADFLALLQDNNELVRVSALVDSSIEIAAITDRATKATPSGPALFFENVKNSTIPVVTNLLGSRRRICLCLGVSDLTEVCGEVERRLELAQPASWLDSLKLVPSRGSMGQFAPKLVKTAACQQVVRVGRDVNLWDLPVPRNWKGELDPVITSGQLAVVHPQTRKLHLFQSPLVVAGQSELGWYDEHPVQRDIIHAAISSGQNLPVSISLGGDPLLCVATGLPWVGDVRGFVGQLRGASLELVRCRTNEIEVPAGSEFILEGYIDAANSRTSRARTVARGNGSYVSRELPLIQLTAITHRANPVFPATVVGLPPSEESWITAARERIQLSMVKRLLPEVMDLHQPFSAAGRNILFVRIRKTVEFQARRILHSLWGLEELGQTKMIVIVDEDVDVQNEAAVWFTVGTNTCPSRDFLFSDGLARDDDYTPLTESLASRVGIDATRKSSRESERPWPETLQASDEMMARVTERWAEYGLAD